MIVSGSTSARELIESLVDHVVDRPLQPLAHELREVLGAYAWEAEQLLDELASVEDLLLGS
jgi:hypothetical protein